MKKLLKNGFVLLISAMILTSFVACAPNAKDETGKSDTTNTPNDEEQENYVLEGCEVSLGTIENNIKQLEIYRKASDESDYSLYSIVQLSKHGETNNVDTTKSYVYIDPFVQPGKAYAYKYKTQENNVYYASGEKDAGTYTSTKGFGEISVKQPYPEITYENGVMHFASYEIDMPSQIKKYYKSGYWIKKMATDGNAKGESLKFPVGESILENYNLANDYNDSWHGSEQVVEYKIGFMLGTPSNTASYPNTHYITKPVDIRAKNIIYTK